MNGVLVLIFWGLLGLLFAAVVVAWWEHLGRQGAAQFAKVQAKAARAVSVDVELDALEASAQGTGDVYERQQTLGGAMARMAGATGTGWTDTAPMIGMGLPNCQAQKDQFEPTAS
jgi:hypothetical protein